MEEEKEDFNYLITAQFFEFNQQNNLYELNQNYRILLDIQTLNDDGAFSQQSLLN